MRSDKGCIGAPPRKDCSLIAFLGRVPWSHSYVLLCSECSTSVRNNAVSLRSLLLQDRSRDLTGRDTRRENTE